MQARRRNLRGMWSLWISSILVLVGLVVFGAAYRGSGFPYGDIAIFAGCGGLLALAVTMCVCLGSSRAVSVVDLVRTGCWIVIGSGLAASQGSGGQVGFLWAQEARIVGIFAASAAVLALVGA